ncbi:cell division protein sepF [Mycolicibacterium canariasense]|uniref:Cell division protein SepF n=1 Tax=Mycolicibacterium canariasense TaxID=228230 RepID=A0A117I8J9_MYCCR|nr:cell division protein SepF [Mycolicibacterium canariasense]MCV7212255.1 cell division protein SepF [Mycolicibacterium canariasense]ORU97361.1 cell division protein SepF [Mycolicibacterium canariasense]GAS93347.1 cell division protein sepF [Mycolicibacterium canariasense]
MSTLHKVKAYFGMAPMDDYEDDYYDDERPARSYARRAVEDRFEDEGYGREPRDGRGFDDRGPREYERDMDMAPGGYRGGYDSPRFEGRLRAPREFDRPAPRFAAAATRGALAMEPRRMAELFEAGSPLAKITTLRPKDYSEARTIGERFRDGTPVIMDLVSMDNADAKRLVDFAAGLAFALRGSFDKVATKVFLLSPADVDVTAEERRRIAEAGFYSYQ